MAADAEIDTKKSLFDLECINTDVKKFI